MPFMSDNIMGPTREVWSSEENCDIEGHDILILTFSIITFMILLMALYS